MTQTKKWVVTTNADKAGDVGSALRKEGFAIEQALTEIGVFTGEASDEVAGRLRSIAGVTDVSPDLPIDIGPPGGGSSW